MSSTTDCGNASSTKATRRKEMAKHGFKTVLTICVLTFCVQAVLAHTIRGVNNPTLAVARLSSPSTAVDRPIPLGGDLALACFNVQNRSPYGARITAIGLDLPGDNTGFALVSPVGTGFELENEVGQIPGFPRLTLDFGLLSGRRFASGNPADGLAASSTPTQFCVSGPFPRDPVDPTQFLPIESLLNYSFVRFKQVGPTGDLDDVGVWELRPAFAVQSDFKPEQKIK
jgi:hypothetical protein